MAPSHRWYDQFVDYGWARTLSPAALRLVLTVGRRVDKALRTRTKLARLQEEAGLPRPTFFRAKAELVRCGLLERKKIDGRWHLALTFPVRPASEESLIRETKRSHQRDFSVSSMRPTKRQTTRPVRVSTDGQQKTGRQLGGQFNIALRQLFEKSGFANRPGICEEVLRIAAAVQKTPARLDTEVHALSRRLQSQGVLLSEAAVRALLTEAVALSDPAVDSAVRLFDGQIVAVGCAPPAAAGEVTGA